MKLETIGAVAVATALMWINPVSASAQDVPDDGVAAEQVAARDAFVASLANMTDGAWMASNAEYRDEDGGIQTFGLALDLVPGGLAAVGCLWGEIDGEVIGVFWQFFQAWDPVAGKGLVYQSSPAGAIAIGHLDPRPDVQPELIQTMFAPDGSSVEVAHHERWTDADTRVGGSLGWDDGEWVPQRTYTWVRERNRATPC